MIKKVISKDQGQALADEYGIKFLETSAKSNIGMGYQHFSFSLTKIKGVEESFFSLARDIKKRLIDTPDAGKTASTGVNLDDAKTVKASGCC